MRILVTGCMGFIGSHYVRKALLAGHEVLGIDNLSNPSLVPTDRIKRANPFWKNFDFAKADIRHEEVIFGLAARFKPDAIVHLAALASVPRSFLKPQAYVDINETGFTHMLTIAKQLSVTRFAYASSSSVYGDHPSPVRIEMEIGRPMSPYGLSKLHNEMMAQVWGAQVGQPSVGLRFFNVYGPGQNPNGSYAAVIPNWLTTTENELTIYGDGKTIRDYTYVEDVANAIQGAIDRPPNGIYISNVGTGKGTTLLELADLVGKPVKHLAPRPGDCAASIARPDFSQSLLKWSARVSLEEGLEQTRRFYAENAGK